MRLRQLLGICLTITICGAFAVAAAPELKNVSIMTQGNTTTVMLVANGFSEHNEDRASQNLLLVDLTGITAGKLKNTEHKLNAVGLHSYRVVGYKGVNGVDKARVELRLAPDAEVKTTEVRAGLEVKITTRDGAVPTAAVPASKPVAAVNPHLEAPSKPANRSAKAASSNEIVKVRSVEVERGSEGMTVEVIGSGPMTARALKLTSPDRIVLDIPNSLPEGRLSAVAVNSGGVRAIRTAKYQAEPPVTRVVVDLASAHVYELNATGNKLVLKLLPVTTATVAPQVHPASSTTKEEARNAVPAVPPVTTEVVASKTSAEISTPARQESKGGAETSAELKPVAFVDPQYQSKQQENGDPATAADKKLASQTTGPRQLAALQAPASQPAAAQAPSSPASAPQLSNRPNQQRTSNSAKPVYTGEPISVNLKDVDIKDFFRLIHEVSGLNVVLDPGVRGSLTIVLEDVPWDQALDVVLRNNSLDRQLDGNVLRIATIDNLRREAQAKRLQLEAEALAVPKVSITRFLSYAHAKDAMPTIKKLLSSRGDLVADERMNALIIQDIPSVIPDVDRLIAELDQKTREVDIEARVVAATRSFKRDIGTQLGLGWGNGPTAIGGLGKAGASPMGGNATAPKYFIDPTNTKIQSIPLIGNFMPTGPTSGFSLMNATNAYRIDLLLGAAERRGLLKILSRPHVVTQNNIQALVKQGVRVPVTTQGQLSGPATVTYIEAVLRLTVTPQITNDNTIFLNLDIENTTPDFSQKILDNPVFLTQQTTTQVLVSDGGTVMVGGVIQTQNSVATDQTPVLGNIPVLGNLFKHRTVDNSTQELIFIITPKIVQT